MAEIIANRTQRNKTFSNLDGTITEVACLSTLHYEGVLDSGSYDTEVNAKPVRVDNPQFDGWRITQCGWHYALGRDLENHGDQDGWVGFGGRQGSHWFKFRLTRAGYLHWPTRDWQDVGGPPDYDRANLTREANYREIHPESSLCLGTVADWTSLWATPGGGSVDASWRARGDGLKEVVTVNEAARTWITANAPPATPLNETWFGFVYELDWSDVPRVFKEGILQNLDEDWATVSGTIELKDAADRLLTLLPIGRVRVAGQKGGAELLRKRFWSQNGTHYMLVGVRCDVLNGLPAGDLQFDPTVTPQVSADDDDAHSWPGGCDETLTPLMIGNDNDPSWNDTGMRFTLNVPAAATISLATLIFIADGAWRRTRFGQKSVTRTPTIRAISTAVRLPVSRPGRGLRRPTIGILLPTGSITTATPLTISIA